MRFCGQCAAPLQAFPEPWELTHSHRVQARAAEGGGPAGCWLVLECGAVSYGKSVPYLPITELAPRQLDVDGLEVVLPGAADDDAIVGHDHARRGAVRPRFRFLSPCIGARPRRRSNTVSSRWVSFD